MKAEPGDPNSQGKKNHMDKSLLSRRALVNFTLSRTFLIHMPIHHQLPESAQIHVHWVSDAIQPSHPLLSPSPPALNLSQHQGLFKWVSSLHQVAKLLELQLQHQSFQWTPKDWSPLGWTGWISLQSKGLSRVFFNTIVQKHQFFGTQPSLWSNSHNCAWLLEKP